MMISPKLGRVRSGGRSTRHPSGLWLRLAIGSIAIHGLVAAIVMTVSDRASEARRASAQDGVKSGGAIEIDVIAVSDGAPSNTSETPRSTAFTTATTTANTTATTTATTTQPQPIEPPDSNTRRNTRDFVERAENAVTQTPTSTSTTSTTPTLSPAPTPRPASPPPQENNQDNSGNTSGTGTDGNPGGSSDAGSGAGSDAGSGGNPGGNNPAGSDADADAGNGNGNGEDTDTSNGSDRLGLIIRLTPLPIDTSDPNRSPARLTAPATNIDLPVNVDLALLPEDLAPPVAIALQIELSIDPTGIPSLVRILEPNRDRELPQFEPLIAALIEDWRFDPASSVANGREVDQLDIVLALQWK